jgi:hypothetical protein
MGEIMVMIFENPKARQQLLSKGIVYTFRKHEHVTGKDWATDRRCGKKICDINIELVKKITDADELLPYVSESGFKDFTEWLLTIQSLNPKMREIRGYLYKVTKST